MRLILVFIHAFLVLATVTAVATVVQSLAVGSPFGGLNAQTALIIIPVLLIWLIEVIAAAMASVFVVLASAPIILALAATLTAAVLSGYRHLRWTRWLAAPANLVGIFYCLKFLPLNGPVWALLVLFSINIVLLALIPDQPDLKMNRRVLAWIHPLLGLVFPTLLCIVMANGHADGGKVGVCIFLSVLSFVPFYFNRKAALDFTRKPILRAVIISAVFLAIWGLIFAPLALPLAFSLLGLLALAEMRLLYPDQCPPPGSAHYYVCRGLSRRRPETAGPLPAAGETDSDFQPLEQPAGSD